MKGRQYIELNEHETGLPGIGKVSYDYEYENSHHVLIITFHSLDKVVTYRGKKAKSTYLNMISETHNETVQLVKRVAAISVGIPLFRIKENSRKREVVWARFLVMWYVNKYLKFSLAESGSVFDKDHATALHGIREINKAPIYQTEKQVEWKSLFLKKCANNSLL